MTSFKTILTGVAFSPNLKANVYETLRLGQFLDAAIVLVHVGQKTKEKEEILLAFIEDFPEVKDQVRILWKEGNPVNVIIDACKETQADLLILGAAQRESIMKYYLGSIARKIAKKAPCSILLLIKPSVERVPCRHIVVNGLQDPKTKNTIGTAFEFGSKLEANKITIVEEIEQSEVAVNIDDDESLARSTMLKEQLIEREETRVTNILNDVDETLKNEFTIKTQGIFGTRGYSIGHYAKIHRANLLVMNKPEKSSLLDKIFPQDIDYILSELPTDVLIVH